jgi:hypothetical protein
MRATAKVLIGPALLISFVTGIAGCAAGSSTQLPQPLTPAHVTQQSDADSALVYVSDHTNNLIDVFNVGGTLQYTITSGLSAPVGLFVDASHNLWVANPGAKNVLEFPRGATTPSQTLSDSNMPNDVTVCGNGTVFVSDSLNKGGVAVYPPGRMHPTRRLEAQMSGQGGLAFFVTCDNAGNIVATGFIGASPFSATTGWRHARESGYYLLQQDAWSSNGITATKARNVLIALGDPSGGLVAEFTEAGKPTGREIETGDSVWSEIALNAKENVVYGADTAAHAAVARTFPGGSIKQQYENANLVEPEGVAVDPGN